MSAGRLRFGLAILVWALLGAGHSVAAGQEPPDATATAGPGEATSYELNPNGGVDYAQMGTAFSPASIAPGEPVTFTASLAVHRESFYPPNDCTPFTHSQDDSYDILGLASVPARQTYWNASADQVTSATYPVPTYFNSTHTTAACPNGTFEESAATLIPAEVTAQLAPGCYQGSAWDSYIWYSGPHVAGTLATLSVGGSKCAPKRWQRDNDFVLECIADSRSCTGEVVCDSLDGCDASASAGSTIGDPECHGGCRAKRFRKLAAGPVDLLPNQRATISLPLTKVGRKLVAQAADRGRTLTLRGRIEFDGDSTTRHAVEFNLG